MEENDTNPVDENQPDSTSGSKAVAIPKVLHSFYEERPFVCCTRCGESLKDFDEGFRITKNFKKDEVIIESAMCIPCLNAMIEETSEESKKSLEEFHDAHARSDISGFEECALCEHTLSEVYEDEYSLVGVCQGEHMHDSAMICNDCQEAMNDVISEETRRTWDRFREENFPGVPSDFEPLPASPSPVG